MAAIRGNSGVIEFGSALASVTSYTLDTTQDTAETSVMGNRARQHIKTMFSYSGSADFIVEATAQFTTISAMDFPNDSGETVAFELQPDGATSGSPTFTGTAILTGVSYTSSFDGTVTGSCTFQGTGPLVSGSN